MNRNSGVLTALGILGIIFGIIFSLTLIGMIVGIPLIIGAKKFLEYAKLTDQEVLELDRQNLTMWLVLYCILLFPIGLLALIVLFNLDGQLSQKGNDVVNAISGNSMESKMRKIKELHEMKEQGIITDEDFQSAKSKILND